MTRGESLALPSVTLARRHQRASTVLESREQISKYKSPGGVETAAMTTGTAKRSLLQFYYISRHRRCAWTVVSQG